MMRRKKSIRFSLLLMLTAMTSIGTAAELVRTEASAAAISLTRAAAAEFAKQKASGAQVTTGIGGAAGAFAALCRGEASVIAVSRPILTDEMDACGKAKVEFVELPIAFDAVTVIVNPRNAFVSSLSVEELRKMWESGAQGTIMKWKQINDRWPDAPLKLLGPDRSSDDGRYFNAAILGNQFARQDYMGSAEDSVLIQAVARDANALAYVSSSSYLANRNQVKAVPIAGKAGATAVAPTAANVVSGAYQPLARPLFLYVSVAALDQPGVRAFSEFLVTNASRLATTAGLTPLTDTTYRAGISRLRNRSKGTLWAGSAPVGLTLDAMQKKQAM
jgi:phosphate transport system substrate-binding protein